MPLTQASTERRKSSQAKLSALIPIVGPCYIIVGLRCENNPLNHAASMPAALPAPMCDLMTDAVKNVPCDGVIQRASPPKRTALRPLGRYCPKGLQRAEGAPRVSLKSGSNSVFIAHQNKGLHTVVQASEHCWLRSCKDFLVPVKPASLV